MDFGVLRSTANTTVLREMDLSAPTPRGTSWRGSASFGLFTGYNWQWDDVIIGAELSYLHGDFGGGVSTSAQFASSGPLSDGLFHDPRVTSTNSISVTDYATFRGRAGYAFGCYLPYAFGGFALGYSNISTSARIDDFVSASSGGPFFGLPPLNGTSNALHHVIYGYTAGLGFDINLIGGLFMRAEWEYLRFTSQVDTNINSIHLGLAYKF
jgi:opacity protein-like surface antigen